MHMLPEREASALISVFFALEPGTESRCDIQVATLCFTTFSLIIHYITMPKGRMHGLVIGELGIEGLETEVSKWVC